MTLFFVLLLSLYNFKCVDIFNQSLTSANNAYVVECPADLLIIFPTACSCGTSPLYRFDAGLWPSGGFLECFCNAIVDYGYARAWCCDTLFEFIPDISINQKISQLKQLNNN